MWFIILLGLMLPSQTMCTPFSPLSPFLLLPPSLLSNSLPVPCLPSLLSLPLVSLSPSKAMMFMCGAKAGFYQGDVKLLIEDIKELKPTIFVTVPRLLNRVYDKVSSSAATQSSVAILALGEDIDICFSLSGLGWCVSLCCKEVSV